MRPHYYGARFYDPVIARWTSVDPLVEAGQESMTPYGYVFGNPIKNTDPDGRYPDGPGDEFLSDSPNGNGLSLIENIVYSTRDMVTSGVATLKSLFGSGPMKEASFDYSSGQRTLVNSPLLTTKDKVVATGNALLGISAIFPADGPAASMLAKTTGVKSSVATVIKDATQAERAITISDVKSALSEVHKELGLEKPLPKGEKGKFGSPTAGDKQKGYRLDPAHPGKPPGDKESVPHINFWGWTKGKKGSGVDIPEGLTRRFRAMWSTDLCHHF